MEYKFKEINEMVDAVTKNAKDKGWENSWNIFEKLALCHSEISEALEELRDGSKPTDIYFLDGKPEGFPIEIADTVIRLMHICGHYGINLEEALNIKMEYNKTRPYRHGNKVA